MGSAAETFEFPDSTSDFQEQHFAIPQRATWLFRCSEYVMALHRMSPVVGRAGSTAPGIPPQSDSGGRDREAAPRGMAAPATEQHMQWLQLPESPRRLCAWP